MASHHPVATAVGLLAALIASVLVQPAEAWRDHKGAARVAPAIIDDGADAYEAAVCDPDGFAGGPGVPAGYYGGPVYSGGPAVAATPPPRAARAAPAAKTDDSYFRRWYETR